MTGRESRLPLRIRGDGVGPKVHFSLDTLDIGNVFLNSQHSYEVKSFITICCKNSVIVNDIIIMANVNRKEKKIACPSKCGN